MNKKIIEEVDKEKRAILANLGKKYGITIPSRGKETIDDKVGSPNYKDMDGDPDSREGYLRCYEECTTFYCEAYREGQIRGNGRHRANREKKGSYQKPFERRLRLVEFVIARWARNKDNRFNWIQITSEWNKSFPIEQIKPEVLRVEYSRAIHEIDLMSHLLAMIALKDRQTGEKPWGKEEFKQFFHEMATEDSKKKSEPVLSLLYKHYALGGLSKTVPMNRKRVEIALKLAKKYREMEKQKRG